MANDRSAPEPFIVALDRAPTSPMRYDRGTVVRLVDAAMGAKQVDIHLNVIRAGSAPGPLHYHAMAENCYLVLSGTARIVIGDGDHVVGPNTFVFIPPGVPHATSNAGAEDLHLLEVYAPAAPDFHEGVPPQARR